MTQTLNIYNFSLIREEIAFLDYISKGVRIGLSIGIDFTQSNMPTNDPSSLHCLIYFYFLMLKDIFIRKNLSYHIKFEKIKRKKAKSL